MSSSFVLFGCTLMRQLYSQQSWLGGRVLVLAANFDFIFLYLDLRPAIRIMATNKKKSNKNTAISFSSCPL